MATNFPASLDSYATVVDNTDDVLAAHMNDKGDAIEALEAKVGVDSSAVSASHDYFLKHASGAYRTHIHDGTSDDGATLDWDTCWSDAVHNHSSNAEGGAIPLGSITNYPFKTGDWIISSVTTARTGWTEVTATYNNKFIRISSGTALDTGGTDTHNHGGATASHTLSSAEIPAHTHSVDIIAGGKGYGGASRPDGYNDSASTTGSTGGGGGHTHTVASANNIPAYVQIKIFQKD